MNQWIPKLLPSSTTTPLAFVPRPPHSPSAKAAEAVLDAHLATITLVPPLDAAAAAAGPCCIVVGWLLSYIYIYIYIYIRRSIQHKKTQQKNTNTIHTNRHHPHPFTPNTNGAMGGVNSGCHVIVVVIGPTSASAGAAAAGGGVWGVDHPGIVLPGRLWLLGGASVRACIVQWSVYWRVCGVWKDNRLAYTMPLCDIHIRIYI